MKLQGRKIYPGRVEGEALVSAQGISFYGGVDPESGQVVERGHDLEGRSIAGKVLVFPTGKGSTVGSYTLYRLKAAGLAPLAIVNASCETITAVGCIIGEIPCVDQIDLSRLASGQRLRVDGESGTVEIDLPAPLRGLERGSFAERTLTTRLPGIARKTIQNGDWAPDVRDQLAALADEMPHGTLRPVQGEHAPDIAQWERWMQPFLGQTWLEAPWFPAEVYFFRRILEATRYFEPGATHGVDPFQSEKRAGMRGVLVQLQQAAADLTADAAGDCREALERLLHTAIWGNQADLSVWPAGGEAPASHEGEQRLAHLLIDQAAEAADYITHPPDGLARVDFILDNVGLELAYDLLLTDFLLAHDLAQTVRFHAKPNPTYVSDATIPDVRLLVDHLAGAKAPEVRALGLRLTAALAEERLQLEAERFWISPLPGWEMDEQTRAGLRSSSLIISKGDANYRRWLGDRHWPFDAPIEPIVSYRPAPLLLLRVLKAEIIAGMKPGQAEAMDAKDPQWMYNGKWGVIQFTG